MSSLSLSRKRTLSIDDVAHLRPSDQLLLTSHVALTNPRFAYELWRQHNFYLFASDPAGFLDYDLRAYSGQKFKNPLEQWMESKEHLPWAQQALLEINARMDQLIALHKPPPNTKELLDEGNFDFKSARSIITPLVNDSRRIYEDPKGIPSTVDCKIFFPQLIHSITQKTTEFQAGFFMEQLGMLFQKAQRFHPKSVYFSPPVELVNILMCQRGGEGLKHFTQFFPSITHPSLTFKHDSSMVLGEYLGSPESSSAIEFMAQRHRGSSSASQLGGGGTQSFTAGKILSDSFPVLGTKHSDALAGILKVPTDQWNTQSDLEKWRTLTLHFCSPSQTSLNTSASPVNPFLVAQRFLPPRAKKQWFENTLDNLPASENLTHSLHLSSVRILLGQNDPAIDSAVFDLATKPTLRNETVPLRAPANILCAVFDAIEAEDTDRVGELFSLCAQKGWVSPKGIFSAFTDWDFSLVDMALMLKKPHVVAHLPESLQNTEDWDVRAKRLLSTVLVHPEEAAELSTLTVRKLRDPVLAQVNFVYSEKPTFITKFYAPAGSQLNPKKAPLTEAEFVIGSRNSINISIPMSLLLTPKEFYEQANIDSQTRTWINKAQAELIRTSPRRDYWQKSIEDINATYSSDRRFDIHSITAPVQSLLLMSQISKARTKIQKTIPPAARI